MALKIGQARCGHHEDDLMRALELRQWGALLYRLAVECEISARARERRAAQKRAALQGVE